MAIRKASINRKSMKAVTNYLIDSLNCSFLLIENAKTLLS